MGDVSDVLHVKGRVLVGPDEVRDELWVVGGRISYERPRGARETTTVTGWALPGLVDAHCHVGLDSHGPVDAETAERQALTDRDAGTLLIRDAGSPSDTRWIDGREDLPKIIRAGRHIARTRRYIRNYAHEIEPPTSSSTSAARRCAATAGSSSSATGSTATPGTSRPAGRAPRSRRPSPRPTGWAPGSRRTASPRTAARPGRGGHRLHRTRHRPHRGHHPAVRGARGGDRPHPREHRDVPEDGGGRRGEVPALVGAHATAPRAAVRHRPRRLRRGHPGLRRHRRGRLPPHGLVAAEVAELVRAGIPAIDALSATTWAAREWLGRPGLTEGAPADLVVYAADPRADVRALAQPLRVVVNGGIRA